MITQISARGGSAFGGRKRLHRFIVRGFVFMVFSQSVVFAQTINERLSGETSLAYDVYFNGIAVGKIEWQYLGQKTIEGRKVDILHLNSDTKIMDLLNLENEERVYLDSQTRLPFKVQRDILFFGKKEIIEEFYNQDEGYVKIIKSNSATEENTIRQDTPIHNILELLYFFPQDVKLKKGQWLKFNLPTQKLEIKFAGERALGRGKKRTSTYFLNGRGARKFNLWLDKVKRLPLRLEFILLVGKVTIVRSDSE